MKYINASTLCQDLDPFNFSQVHSKAMQVLQDNNNYLKCNFARMDKECCGPFFYGTRKERKQPTWPINEIFICKKDLDVFYLTCFREFRSIWKIYLHPICEILPPVNILELITGAIA